MKLAVQPPVDFVEPFIQAAAEHDYLTQNFMDYLVNTLQEGQWRISAISCTRTAADHIRAELEEPPLRLLPDWDPYLGEADMVIELTEVID